MRLSLLAPLLLLGCVASPERSGGPGPEQMAPAQRAQVMVLGTYHLHNPGADYAQFKVRDVLSPEGQAEVEEVVAALARFRPTKIAVEWPAQRSEALDAEYARYLGGTLPLQADEIHQVAFRLAQRLGHPRLYAVDYRKDMDIGGVLQAAGERYGQEQLVRHLNASIARVERLANARARQRLGETLRQLNHPRELDEGHALYLRLARIGSATELPGADAVAGWLERNLKIYVHLTRIIDSPQDRVLVLYGAGHAKLLREHVQDSDDLELVDPRPYLPR